uniref:SPX domain-containing protein 2-like n=1 Tax=Erigeron canadensis TaxID=72917 RepID=UPI001CB9AB87|nr:SPX domain-containing protein 2-like [Erigeron canadensis]
MHYRKQLKILIDDMLPEWRDKFLSYKDLKKQLSKIYPKEEGGNSKKRIKIDPVTVEKEVDNFVKLCQQQIDKFNDFFLEKEEWYIIKIEVLEGNLVAAHNSNEELMKELADLHGEIVLLLNYSALNYTGLVKILKKHDKFSGALIRLPFIQKVVNEPFYKTDVLNSLVKKCLMMLDQLFSTNEQGSSPPTSPIREEEPSLTVPTELVDIKNRENTYMKQTLSALTVLKGIRSGSSTVNMFSLPPMQ